MSSIRVIVAPKFLSCTEPECIQCMSQFFLQFTLTIQILLLIIQVEQESQHFADNVKNSIRLEHLNGGWNKETCLFRKITKSFQSVSALSILERDIQAANDLIYFVFYHLHQRHSCMCAYVHVCIYTHMPVSHVEDTKRFSVIVWIVHLSRVSSTFSKAVSATKGKMEKLRCNFISQLNLIK